ncbi:MAG: hypothetical protein QM703_10325 [Gemmatales bacterium]
MLTVVLALVLIECNGNAQDESKPILSKRYLNHLYYGDIDESGNFVPSVTINPINITRGYPKSSSIDDKPFVSAYRDAEEVYEYRSFRLVPGTIRRGEFAPDISGKVIDFADYQSSKNTRRIYNLPPKPAPGRDDETHNGDSKQPAKLSPQDKPSELKVELVRPFTANEEYEFKLTPSVQYSRKFGNHLYFGTLDDYGNFVPSPTMKPIEVGKGMPKDDGKFIPLMSHIPQKEVYEFRFRTLIPGTIQNGEFIPDLGGGKIIDFADYKYSKDAKPIYNLPGKFFPVPKGK